MSSVLFYFKGSDSTPDSGSIKGFLSTPRGLLQDDRFLELSQESLSRDVENTVRQVMEMFDTQEQFATQFEVDEIEFGLHISTDGKVAVVAEDSCVSSTSSIKVRLKRKRA